MVDGFLRGLAILWGAPEGHGTVNAPRREDELRQIRPLVFAIAMGKRTGDGRLLLVGLSLRRQILSLDADGRRSKVHRPFVQPIDLIGTHSPGRKNLHGPHVIEAL